MGPASFYAVSSGPLFDITRRQAHLNAVYSLEAARVCFQTSHYL